VTVLAVPAALDAAQGLLGVTAGLTSPALGGLSRCMPLAALDAAHVGRSALAVLSAVVAVSSVLGVLAVARADDRRRLRARLAAPARSPAPLPRHARRPEGPALAAAAGLAVAWMAAGPALAVGLVVGVAAGQARARLRRRAARRHRREAQLAPALDRLAAALRSGASLPAALDEVGHAVEPPIGPELGGLARQAAHGRPLRRVLDGWAATHGDPGTRLAATALVLATVVGAAPARAVDGVAATVRERLDLAAERRALAAQARTSALVLSVAPAGFAALLVAGDTAAAGFLLGTPAGWACLAAGLALDAAGIWWMAHLTRGDRW
jgi:tight adherence protein B